MHERPELSRSIGRWSLAALVLNGVVGSGIFVLPGTVGGRLGWSGIGAWLVAAAVTAVVVFCFAEVASRFSQAGGPYLYTRAAFGGFVGLQIGWMTYFVRAISAAVQANLFAAYLAELWPAASTSTGRLLATTLFIGALAAINVRGVRTGARVSNSFAFVKLVPLVLFGLLGVAWVAMGRSTSAPVASDATVDGWLGVVLLLMFAFGGFESALFPLAEAKDPRRDAPFALVLGLVLVTIVYTAAQITVLATLSEPAATERPLAESARAMFGARGATAMAIVALVSVSGWLSMGMLAVPRLTMAMAERGDMPAFLARVHPVFRTPWASIVAFAAVSWVLAIQAGLLSNLSLSAVSRLLVYGLVCAALPVLRRKERRGDATAGTALFRAPAGPVLAALGIAASLVLAARMNAREGATLAVTVVAASAYWLATRRGRRDAAVESPRS